MRRFETRFPLRALCRLFVVAGPCHSLPKLQLSCRRSPAECTRIWLPSPSLALWLPCSRLWRLQSHRRFGMADHTATCSSQSCCVFHSGVRGTVFESDVCRRAVRAMNLSADDTDFFKAFTPFSMFCAECFGPSSGDALTFERRDRACTIRPSTVARSPPHGNAARGSHCSAWGTRRLLLRRRVCAWPNSYLQQSACTTDCNQVYKQVSLIRMSRQLARGCFQVSFSLAPPGGEISTIPRAASPPTAHSHVERIL